VRSTTATQVPTIASGAKYVEMKQRPQITDSMYQATLMTPDRTATAIPTPLIATRFIDLGGESL